MALRACFYSVKTPRNRPWRFYSVKTPALIERERWLEQAVHSNLLTNTQAPVAEHELNGKAGITSFNFHFQWRRITWATSGLHEITGGIILVLEVVWDFAAASSLVGRVFSLWSETIVILPTLPFSICFHNQFKNQPSCTALPSYSTTSTCVAL